MAIKRPKAIGAAPACGPQRSGGCQPGDFLGSRGMGAAQGKKVARRRCGIDDRGAAGLRPDQAFEEAARERATRTANKQGEPAPSRTEEIRRASVKGTRGPENSSANLDRQRGRSEAPCKTAAIRRFRDWRCLFQPDRNRAPSRLRPDGSRPRPWPSLEDVVTAVTAYGRPKRWWRLGNARREIARADLSAARRHACPCDGGRR